MTQDRMAAYEAPRNVETPCNVQARYEGNEGWPEWAALVPNREGVKSYGSRLITPVVGVAQVEETGIHLSGTRFWP